MFCWWLLSIYCWLLSMTSASLVNYTIDDTFQDMNSTSGSVRYGQATRWSEGQGLLCDSCIPEGTTGKNGTQAPGDPSQFHGDTGPYMRTWHQSLSLDGQPDPTLALTFSGTAIWVYGLLFYYSGANVSFSVDGNPDQDPYIYQGQSNPRNGEPQYYYNRLMYSTTNLQQGSHTIVLTNNRGSMCIFDYAIYATEVPDSTSSTTLGPSITSSGASTSSPTSVPASTPSVNIGAIVGSAIGGVAVVLLALLVLRLFVLRRRQSQQESTAPNLGNPTTLNDRHTQAPMRTISPLLSTPSTRHFPSRYGKRSYPSTSQIFSSHAGSTSPASPEDQFGPPPAYVDNSAGIGPSS